MKSYKNLLMHILQTGVDSDDRTGVGTRKVFGYQFRHRLVDGFPLLTGKKMSWVSLTAEFVWMMRGLTDLKSLEDMGCKYWKPWAKNGQFGPIYGRQWRAFGADPHALDGNEDPAPFPGIDQIKAVYESLQRDPNGRRHIVTAWNPVDLPVMQLPPCHMMFQFGVMGKVLNIHMVQRSADAFLGVPYNIAFYSLMLLVFAQCLGMEPGEVVISFTDLHIYQNHFDAVHTYLDRPEFELPQVFVDPDVDLPWLIKQSDLDLVGYRHGDPIKAEVAV